MLPRLFRRWKTGPVDRHGTAPYAPIALAIGLAVGQLPAQQQPTPQDPDAAFRFKSGVELINIAASVFDESGRFVPGLSKDDFLVYEDDQPQTVAHFSAERVPVSLGIALDTSGSMARERIREAQTALRRFLYDLLGPDDEIFLYRFGDRPVVEGWTTDRELLSRGLDRTVASGATAMYDAVAEAVRLAGTGKRQKKALILLSDGNDTTSRTSLREVHERIRESEALVYAIGIECSADSIGSSRRPDFQRRGPMPFPIPFPPGGRRGWPIPRQPAPPQSRTWMQGCSEPVDRAALRDLTDDSGGRTEIVTDPRDLDTATAGIADELSRQYYLGYLSARKKDGRWHAIRVEVRDRHYRIRARRGYVAS